MRGHLFREIATFVERKRVYLFGSFQLALGKLSVRSIQRLVARYREELSLPEKFTPHKGRHTFLSRLVQQGVDISLAGKLAGHANLPRPPWGI